LTRLVALRNLDIGVGTIADGQEFVADCERTALQLVSEGAAAPVGQRLYWDALPWRGASVVVIASGPSLTVEDCEAVGAWRNGRDRRVIVVNNSYQRAPWADVLYACDGRWWNAFYQKLDSFAGQLWTQDEVAAKKWTRLHLVRSETKPGLGKRIGVINQGANGGYQAVGLAYQVGAARIVLLGFDVGADAVGRSHWHGDHPRPMHSVPQYEIWAANFVRLAWGLAEMGVVVRNASRRTRLTCFPRVKLDEALA